MSALVVNPSVPYTLVYFQVQIDEAQDEMASYFNRETTPKVLLTTSDRPGPVTGLFTVLLSSTIKILKIWILEKIAAITQNFVIVGFTVY